MRIFLSGMIIFLVLSSTAKAYSDFIAYGYKSCLTCHVNGHGGGALNDYGRSLWASEIASRSFYSDNQTEDDIADSAGFLGKTELPSWLRPAIKYRGLSLRNNPGSPSSTETFYNMQMDVGSSFIFDVKSNYLLQVTLGSVSESEAARLGQSSRWIPRELYLRMQPYKGWWIYLGHLDKVFGIRNVDHTSYQRYSLGLGQYSQSTGIVIHRIADPWEISWNGFVGNPMAKDQNAEHRGFSTLVEYDLAEKKRVGGSVLVSQSQSQLNKKIIYSGLYKQGLSKGTSLMAEYGWIQDQSTSGSQVTTLNGSYGYLSSMILLTRGYHIHTAVEKYNKDISTSSPDQWRFSFGLLAFPISRIEMRIDAVHARSISETSVGDDQWNLQGQLHVSL